MAYQQYTAWSHYFEVFGKARNTWSIKLKIKDIFFKLVKSKSLKYKVVGR